MTSIQQELLLALESEYEQKLDELITQQEQESKRLLAKFKEQQESLESEYEQKLEQILEQDNNQAKVSK